MDDTRRKLAQQSGTPDDRKLVIENSRLQFCLFRGGNNLMTDFPSQFYFAPDTARTEARRVCLSGIGLQAVGRLAVTKPLLRSLGGGLPLALLLGQVGTSVAPEEVMADHTPQPRLIGASVLVVDDDSDVRDLLRASFERLGAVVSTAESVEEALATLMVHVVDLIVSDIGMPNRDGYSLISAVRSAYIVNNLPAIAYTALCSPKERKHAMKAGFTAHVCKQADLGVLLYTAEKLLQSSSLPSSAAPRVFWG